MPLLEVRDLQTIFSTPGGVVKAVDGITFDVSAGETLALVGESGCGKSVTALSLMRLIDKTGRIVAGQVLFDGRDLLKLPEHELRAMRGNDMAMIFQDPMSSLNPVMPIGRQISEGLQVHLRMKRSAARKRAVELLKLVGIPSAEKRIDDYPHQFSGGMRQRVMIAIALSCEPKLIIADEITTALDVTIQAQILELLKDLGDRFGTAIILITHDLGIVARVSQRTQVMYAGRIVERLHTSELYADPRMPYTWGLLRSVPRLDEKRTDRLVPIEGLPPSLLSPPEGCRFEPRCQYRREICSEREPELGAVPGTKPGHEARCWGTQDNASGGWLVDADWRRDLGNLDIIERIRQEALRSTVAETTDSPLPPVQEGDI